MINVNGDANSHINLLRHTSSNWSCIYLLIHSIRYLSVKDAATTLQQEANNPAVGGSPPPNPPPPESRIGRCREFFSRLDSCSSEGGVLEQALNGELHDEARMERLRRMER